MYRVLSFWDRVCIDIHDTQYTKHDVFVYRVSNSNSVRATFKDSTIKFKIMGPKPIYHIFAD